MKKKNLHTILLAVLLSLSFVSYLFINSRKVVKVCENISVEVPKQESEEPESSILLPDVEIVKHVMDAVKHFLPAS